MTFSKALQVFKKWGAIGAPAFTNGRVGEDEQQPSIWFEKALQEFLSQVSDPHEKYESISNEVWSELKVQFNEAVSHNGSLLYIPKNTRYQLVGVTKSKLGNGKWYPAAIYKNETESFTRILCDFEKFELTYQG